MADVLEFPTAGRPVDQLTAAELDQLDAARYRALRAAEDAYAHWRATVYVPRLAALGAIRTPRRGRGGAR